jgi:HAMP domain-containing protein
MPGGRVLAIAVPLREVDQTLARLILVELLVGAGVILALTALGWAVIRFSLRPLERMGRVASEIAHGDLTRRVTPDNQRTEVGRLGTSLNEMLVQIEQAFADRGSEDRLRRFLSDASHELRTPLASILGYAKLFRLGAANKPEELERAMARIKAEATRMGVLVEHLLLLADLEQLRQVLGNLTRNAVIHTPADTVIEISVRREDDRAVLGVRDRGPGVPAGAGDRVFDRSVRADWGRSTGSAVASAENAPAPSGSGSSTIASATTTSVATDVFSPGLGVGGVALGPLGQVIGNGDFPPSSVIPIYKAAGRRYQIPWQVLAAINGIETDYGRDLSVSSAGAIGSMQLMPATWRSRCPATGSPVRMILVPRSSRPPACSRPTAVRATCARRYSPITMPAGTWTRFCGASS